MTFKIYDGTTWNTQKSLKLYDGTSWSNAVKGWVYNGTSWQIAYPEFPTIVTAPTVSGNTSIGSTLTVTNGTWNSDDAYAPTSYSYQWKSGTTNVGSNQNTYVTVSGDSGSTITCEVTAINQRGSTPVTSSNGITVALPAPSSLSVYDNTPAPGNFSVNGSGGVGSWSATHTASTNATYYAGAAGSTGSQPSSGQVWTPGGIWYSSSQTFQSLQTWGAGTVTIYIFATNANPRITASWAAVSGATSYDVSWSGGASGSANTTGTSYDIYPGTTSTITVTVTTKSGSISGGSASSSAAGTNPQTVRQTSVTVTAPAVAPSTPTGLVNTYSASNGPGWTLTWNSSSGTPTITYYWTLYQSQSNGGSTTASTSGQTTGNTTGRIAMSSANGLWGQFYLYAGNSAGFSGVAISSWA
jgi:hypothetical protein